MEMLEDIADWWDEQHRQSLEILDHFVEENPNLFAVAVATVVALPMELAAGTVDLLRFGQGVTEGGVGGYFKDSLRLVGIVVPVARGAGMAQASLNGRLARLIVDPGGGICGWVSATQALRQTGTRAFAAVDDLAQALGTTVSNLQATTFGTLILSLKGIGARMGSLVSVKTLDDVARMTKSNGAVTMFSVFGQRMEQGVLRRVGHALYAYRDALGRLRILDRGGRSGELPQVFTSLDELAKKYGLRGSWAVEEAAVMENLFVKVMNAIGSAPTLALSVVGLAGTNRLEHEAVARAFEIHRVVQQKGRKALEDAGARHHVVVGGEQLRGIAQRYHGRAQEWPSIYEANRDVIGPDPDRIKPGQRLLIPALPAVRGIRGR
jgi:hypothetical protein